MFFFLHIFFMAISTLGIIACVCVAMFFRRKKNWLTIHRSVNSLGLLGLSTGLIMAFLYVAHSGNQHLDGSHQVAGLVAFTLILMTFLLGFYQFRAKNKPAARTGHRWTGRVSVLMFCKR
jgi:hypothetical protein